MSSSGKLIDEVEDVLGGGGAIVAILRLSATKHAARKLTQRVLHLERVRALRSAYDSPEAFAAAEAQLLKRIQASADELEGAAARTHLWEKAPRAGDLVRATRRLVIEAIAAKHAARKAAQRELTGELKNLWDALHKDPAHRAILEELGTDDFVALVKHTEVKGTGWTGIKGRMSELLADRTQAWLDEITEAGQRAARAIAVLPEPDRWKFVYSREGIVAHAFNNPKEAAIPAELMDLLPFDPKAADPVFSEISKRVLEYVDKSAWLTRDFGGWQVALPLLFGESKGLRNFRDLVKQFPKDVDRAGLVYAEIGGKPTLILLAPSLSRPKFVALGPRELSELQAERIAAVGAAVKSAKLPVSNQAANAFSKRLEALLTKGEP